MNYINYNVGKNKVFRQIRDNLLMVDKINIFWIRFTTLSVKEQNIYWTNLVRAQTSLLGELIHKQWGTSLE